MDIIIADDHPIFRAGLTSTLTGIFCDAAIRETGRMDSLLKLLKEQPADLLLLDVFFPGLEPEAGIRDIRRSHPLLSILVVSMLIDRGAVERLLRAGANGFVSKTAPPDSLQKGLLEVMEGDRRVYLPPSRSDHMVNETGNPIAALPKRQMEVLRLICLGLSNKEIARDLNLSASTVRAHISALFRKLDVSNRAAAASYGAMYGVIGSPHYTNDRRP